MPVVADFPSLPSPGVFGRGADVSGAELASAVESGVVDDDDLDVREVANTTAVVAAHGVAPRFSTDACS